MFGLLVSVPGGPHDRTEVAEYEITDALVSVAIDAPLRYSTQSEPRIVAHRWEIAPVGGAVDDTTAVGLLDPSCP